MCNSYFRCIGDLPDSRWGDASGGPLAELADLLAGACRRLVDGPLFEDCPTEPPPGDLIDVRPSALMGDAEGGRA